MRSTIITSIAALLLLAGCSVTGPTYSSVSNEITSPEKGLSQLIIYRPDAFVGQAVSFEISTNSANTCGLQNGSFYVSNVKDGPVDITGTYWGMPGTSQMSFNAKKDGKYFIRVAWNDGKAWSGVFGVVGMGVAEATSSHSGPFLIDILDEQSAEPELQQLKMNTQCH